MTKLSPLARPLASSRALRSGPHECRRRSAWSRAESAWRSCRLRRRDWPSEAQSIVSFGHQEGTYLWPLRGGGTRPLRSWLALWPLFANRHYGEKLEADDRRPLSRSLVSPLPSTHGPKGLAALAGRRVRSLGCSCRAGRSGGMALLPSRPGEFHPEPLTDSGLDTLASSGSCHRTKAAAFRRNFGLLPGYNPVGPSSTAMTRPLRSTGITPLHHYYGAVRPSPAHRYFQPRGWSRLCFFPWHRRPGSHVPHKSQIELRAARGGADRPSQCHQSCDRKRTAFAAEV